MRLRRNAVFLNALPSLCRHRKLMLLVTMPLSSETVSEYHRHCQARVERDANI